MSDIIYRPPAPGDVRSVAANMRADDVAELRALGQDNVYRALCRSVESSTWAATALAGEEPIALLGVAVSSNLMSPCAVPWMLGTPGLHRIGRLFWTEAKRVVYAMSRDYDYLANYVWAGSPRSVRFLEKLGFTIRPPVLAATGESFHRFEMIKPCVT